MATRCTCCGRAPKRVRKTTDEPQYVEMMTRVARNLLKRSDVHSIDTLHSIVSVRSVLDEVTEQLVHHLRSEEGGSHSWTQIADVLGVSRQAARQKFGGEDAPTGARKPGGQPAELR